MSETLLTVSDLTLALDGAHGGARVVDGVSFSVPRSGSLGIVGESGSGKSLTLRAVMGLLPGAVEVRSGSVSLGAERLALAGRTARRQRRRRIAMVFQDSLTALDPVYPVGSQIAEVSQHVLGLSRRAARARAVELLGLVGIRDPERRSRAYPHELSGGMCQRAMLAVALATDPEVLLCDEPTTALDVTVQAQVLSLLDDLRRRLSLTVVFVSHDLAVVRQMCDELAVMYAGRIVETGRTETVLAEPLHPYTRGLLEATIDLGQPLQVTRPIPGAIPEPGHLPSGCAFHPRCGYASEECTRSDVALETVGAPARAEVRIRRSACLHWPELVTR